LSGQDEYDVLEELIILGKEKGYLSNDEVKDALPENFLRPERHYNSACFLLADLSRVAKIDNYSEPAADLSAKQFLETAN